MSGDPFAELLAAMEAQTTLSRELLDALKATNDRQADLGDEVLDLANRLTFIASRARVLLMMKAATATLDCLRCGATFAGEPGPQLCGPCWTELGRPERYLEPVPPIGA
jgi:hypothetical protein